MARNLQVSKTSLMTFCQCPYLYYQQYVLRAKTDKTMVMLMGEVAHGFVRRLESFSGGQRRFYYKTLESSQGAWKHFWLTEVEARRPRLSDYSEPAKWQCLNLGWTCVKHYWEQNLDKEPPRIVERKYRCPVQAGVEIVGVVDQVRVAPWDWLVGQRPEIIRDGRLIPGFSTDIIVDLKSTTRHDAWYVDDNVPLAEQVRRQASLHKDLQALVYTWLWWEHYNVMPAGFLFYMLYEGKTYFTYREVGDFWELYDVIDNLLLCINNDSFPRHSGYHCRYCSFYKDCVGGDLKVSKPGLGVDAGTFSSVSAGPKAPSAKQLRFGFTRNTLGKRKD